MKKWKKYLVILLISIGALFLLTFYGSSPLINSIVEDKIKDQHFGQIYKLDFKSAHFNIFEMGIIVKGIVVYPDSSSLMQKQYALHKNIAHIYIKRLSITALDFISLIKKEKLHAEKLKLIKPIVSLYKNAHFDQKAFDLQKEKNGMQQKDTSKKSFQGVEFARIILKDALFSLYVDEDKKPDLVLGKVNINMEHPIVDFQMLNAPLKAISLEDLFLEITKIEYRDKKGLYDIRLNKMTYNFHNQSMELSDFMVNPRLSKKAFAAKHTFQVDRISLEIASIKMGDLDIDRLLDAGVLAVGKTRIDQLVFEDFRDKNYKFNTNKFPKFPQEALKTLNAYIEFDSIWVRNAELVYTEKAKGADRIGLVSFKKMEVNIQNLGNTKDFLNNKSLNVQAQSLIYGKGKLHVKMEFPLNRNVFYVNGHVGSMAIASVNKITIPNIGLKIKKGTVDDLAFQFYANKTSSKGDLTLEYHDLKVSLIKKQKKTGRVVDKTALNLLANTILPKQNPDKKGVLYKAKINFERNENKGVFAYLWKSVFSGLKDTFLKKENPEKKPKKKKKKKKWFS
ncbi:MAG: hypothetical protein B7C24_01575 [Bacteroidetes bacterium 4572_77]|nr:MAG: hypothetical protein B7C24_01575 [Bacteroidetes bacterium 4572_77]